MFFTVVDIKNKIQVTVVSNQLNQNMFLGNMGYSAHSADFTKCPDPRFFISADSHSLSRWTVRSIPQLAELSAYLGNS